MSKSVFDLQGCRALTLALGFLAKTYVYSCLMRAYNTGIAESANDAKTRTTVKN